MPVLYNEHGEVQVKAAALKRPIAPNAGRFYIEFRKEDCVLNTLEDRHQGGWGTQQVIAP